MFQVKADSRQTIQFHLGRDELIDRSQGENLRDRLNELGVDNDYTLYSEAIQNYSSENILILGTWLKIRDFFLKFH